MLTEIRTAIRPAVVILLLLAGITGLAYPALIAGLGQVAFPVQANGSLIVANGTVVGSELIAQGFVGARYFHPRASAAGKGYDASASGATNLAPGSKDLRDAIANRVAEARVQGMAGPLPADLVTTSASGLDPDLSPEAAFSQVGRIAKARNMPATELHRQVEHAIAFPALGLIGDAHVNVLMLNRQIDGLSAKTSK
ncbi:potassium-transporting ATPase subunit KdpC [Sphingomonas sp.]|uniref:potassium-transporting ATPase subunit KdpC n=1 Tax=Sphingomonas sp. TaxID=28214 RepID=UPI0025CBE86E|nr:potassium-transporting ATPase subunit KdpC [Sphingomonas sp.]